MPGSHHLLWLSFAAIRSAPERPLIFGTNRLQGIPELRRNARVRRVFHHAHPLTVHDLPPNLATELEVVTLVVNRPGAIRLHQDAAVGRGNQLFQAQRLLTRQQADVRHADHRQPIPPFGAHRATRAVQPNVVRRLPRTQVSGKKPLRNDRNALRSYAFIIESKRTQAGPMLLPGIGDYIHQIASITQPTQLLERQKRSSRKVRFHSQHAIQFDGMSDGLMDLQAQL